MSLPRRVAGRGARACEESRPDVRGQRGLAWPAAGPHPAEVTQWVPGRRVKPQRASLERAPAGWGWGWTPGPTAMSCPNLEERGGCRGPREAGGGNVHPDGTSCGCQRAGTRCAGLLQWVSSLQLRGDVNPCAYMETGNGRMSSQGYQGKLTWNTGDEVRKD